MIARILTAAAAIAAATAPAAAAQTAATVAAPGFTAAIGDAEVARWERIARRSDPDEGARHRETALSFLIQAAWIEGEAQERGIAVTRAEVDEELRQTRLSLGHETLKEFRRYLRTELKRTYDDMRRQQRTDMLTTEIRNQITEPAAQSVTPEQIEAYVQQNPRTEPERRRVRFITARTRAQAIRAHRAIREGLTFKSAHRRYSTAPRPTETFHDEPERTRLLKAIFDARANQLIRYGKTVFKVVRITPERPTPIEQQRAQAWEILSSQAQERALDAFTQAFRAKWRPRTICAPQHATHQDCGNSPTGE